MTKEAPNRYKYEMLLKIGKVITIIKLEHPICSLFEEKMHVLAL